jgi:O-antigen/teichoic acid export membrane protein
MDALQRVFASGLRSSLIAGAVLTIVLAAATPFLQVAYGDAFSGAWAAYLILVVALGLYCVSHLHQVLLWARGRTGIVWALTSVMLVWRVALNLMLLPSFGVVGAASAAAISEATLIVLQIVVVWRLLRESPSDALNVPGAIGATVAAKAA